MIKNKLHQIGEWDLSRSAGQIKRKRLLPILAAAAALVSLGANPPAALAAEFSEAELYFELNDTDGDLGIHSSIDGGPYVRLEIEDPSEKTILTIAANGRLARQGLTQLFFESAEPSFDELAPEKFFQRFPEGLYEIEATTSNGKEFEAVVELSHVLAAPPSNILVSGVPSEPCDSSSIPEVPKPVVIKWDPVTQSHPTIGKSGPVEISRYQLFVEHEDIKLAIDLPPTVTSFKVPPQVINLSAKWKFEIIARTTDGNNTAVENCFTVAQP